MARLTRLKLGEFRSVEIQASWRESSAHAATRRLAPPVPQIPNPRCSSSHPPAREAAVLDEGHPGARWPSGLPPELIITAKRRFSDGESPSPLGQRSITRENTSLETAPPEIENSISLLSNAQGNLHCPDSFTKVNSNAYCCSVEALESPLNWGNATRALHAWRWLGEAVGQLMARQLFRRNPKLGL
jgi:hypothetical protein